MQIILYNNTSDPNTVNKNLQTVATLNGELRENTDILNPSLEIEGDEVLGANYLYIDSLNRYYFINDVEFISGEIFRVNCQIDVLMSYADEIKAQNAIIKRQQYNYNVDLVDNRLKTSKNPYIQTINFSGGFSQTNWSYILIMGGNGFYIDTTPPVNPEPGPLTP